MGTILLVDDDAAFLKLLEKSVVKRYPGLRVLTSTDPLGCLTFISEDLELLVVDLEMPGMDGAKILSYAVSTGLDRNRIIILSGHDAEYLHERFPQGSCLAVLNKHEEEQNTVLDRISAALGQRSGNR